MDWMGWDDVAWLQVAVYSYPFFPDATALICTLAAQLTGGAAAQASS